ncbi:hypothetical protein A7Y00_19010 [Stenotrophomonas maltophilia]|jgi:hypothetical protein|uniref:hypothetical protein n=1 Tax=Stenotrophomonas TaxID=40323 RepID=UPI000DAA8671|nr:hypothetical protein [Stenotrophomonas sp. PAMC25021]MBH1513266.1 hypothetical protein [Stenotrophomonas maltophilia]MBH1547370.1 hypothetical protein [Stenotrophomonas maltophilia]MBH1862991.1 hypothetical protein [Stenotrophomonas maltophilia]MBN5064269.1 hypothetical protein [Stenotrophomonas maltophilia]MCU1033016.1 hypothetical protein [Stenotrophomonas maltophilia]
MHFTSMGRNLERMRAALTEWMIKEEILGDAFFVDIETWRSRGESYGDDSLLVLAFDGSTLHTMLNSGGDTEEFDDLIDSFGFGYELGHSWSMGFYPIEGYDYSRLSGSYSSKLQDERWRKKAAAVKARAGHQCQDCGATKPLDAHHCYYATMREGFEPWEYPLSALRALCRECHIRREKAEIRLRAFAASLTSQELDALRPAISHAIYWHQTKAVFSSLSALGPEERHLQAALEILRNGRNDPDR